MHSLDKLKNIDVEFIDKITKLYQQTSKKGSRHSQPIGVQGPAYSDLLDDVKKIKEDFKIN